MVSTTLLALALLTTIARAADNTTSLSTLAFKNAFIASGIVPSVIPALDPSVSFYTTYKSTNGHSDELLLLPGTPLTPSEAAASPLDFIVEGLNNATNITAATRYLIYLLDADAPGTRNLRHYLAGNYTVLPVVNSSVLPSAQRLVVQPGSFAPFTPFTPPNPEPSSGVHRFIYALYKQPANFSAAGFETAGMEPETRNWNLSRWRTQLGLGPAIGATFFTIDTAVAGQSTNSTRGTTTVGAGPGGSGAVGLAVPAYMVGFTAIHTLVGLVAFL
ncbi:phosphatidylethanolamine-binding protein [Podospora appendiculata]|uniref:Phosphatidylethanolamine-binding protein n=1 Tax=Podospora appendiculata TaxID=314037 RepID=A0AAE1CBJ4_9PEZI|nr:phosphatidylethanolamine-binding protein [Podospora appendiculata]